MPSFQKNVEGLHIVAKQLNDASSDLNIKLNKFSSDLRTTGICVEVWVDDNSGWSVGFCKVANVWTLAANNENREPVAIERAPWYIRHTAVTLIDTISEKLLKKAEKRLFLLCGCTDKDKVKVVEERDQDPPDKDRRLSVHEAKGEPPYCLECGMRHHPGDNKIC